MPTNPNMVAIQTVTVGAGGASSITFSNIPQTYTDLVVKVSARNATSSGTTDMGLRFNGSSGSNYAQRHIYGDGSAAYSGSDTGQNLLTRVGVLGGTSSTANTFNNAELYIPNYTGSTNKSLSIDAVQENNGTTAFAHLIAGLWSQTAAITSLTLYANISNLTDNFAQYSTATLYGVTSAGYGAKATGGIITQDANYFYHTFLSSGTFTPTQNLTVDYLVVAGGGGGGAGGAGGGGVRCTVGATGGGGSLESPLSLTASTNYTVTVGAGGTGATDNYTNSSGRTGGSNSVFSSVTSTGGGGGGTGDSADNAANPSSTLLGGSGGGASYSSGSASYGLGTTNQGYAGGQDVFNGAPYAASGGGGAGAVGQNSQSNSVAGAGGAGVTTSISGSSRTYGGGGGGGIYGLAGSGTAGAGGSGGGGNGSNGALGSNGTANTGGGAGGGGTNYGGAQGGSGIVIVRYAR